MIAELGAYRISGHNGNFIPQAKACGFNHAYVGAGADAGTSDVPAAQRQANLKALLKKLASKGFKITLDLERHSPALGFKQVLKAAKPVWSSITRIVLADEAPKLDYHALAYKVDVAISDMGLEAKPIGAVFTPRQIIDKEVSNADLNTLMFVGVEAYCDIPLTASVPAMQVRQLMSRAVGRLGDMPKLFIAAAYNRNGAFTSPADIIAVNDEAWDWADAYDSPLYAFAFGRTGGLKDLPFLRDWYATRA
jgi:hypothetical protein